MADYFNSPLSDISLTSLDDFDTLSTYLIPSDDHFSSLDLAQYPSQNPPQQAPQRPLEDPQQANLK